LIADRLAPTSPDAAQQVRSLAGAAFRPDALTADVLAWSEVDLFRAFDPAALASRATQNDRPQLRRTAEWAASVRNVLVFAPVLVTWVGLGIAAATYATCHLAALAKETPSFLFLWQRGFVADGATCDSGPSALHWLPLNTFGEVVVADALILIAVIVLTILAQALSSQQESSRQVLMGQLAEDLRVFLVEAARRLHVVRMAEDASARQTLFVSAFGTLETVAKEFAGKADDMIVVLDKRSQEAEVHLARITDTYRVIADDARNATSLLGRVLSSTTESAEALSSGIGKASGEFAALGGRLELAAGELKTLGGSIEELLALDRSTTKRADEVALKTGEIATSVAKLSTIDASLRNLTVAGGRFETAAAELKRMQASLNDLLSLDRSAQKRFDETALNTHAIAESITTLTSINQNIRDLALEIRRSRDSDRIVLPRLGWQLGIGAIGLLALFQLFTAAVVWSDRSTANRDLPPAPVATSAPQFLPPREAPAQVPVPALEPPIDSEPARGPR